MRGVALFYDAGRPTRATIENLSVSGALVSIATTRPGSHRAIVNDVELNLGFDSGRVSARTVRVEQTARRTRIALTFERVDSALSASIDYAIDHALTAAQRRPIIIIDQHAERRASLSARLVACGMTTHAPTTPLAAFAQLARTQRSGCVCLLAPCFGQSVIGLRNVIAETFPWAITNVIGDDLESTVDRTLAAWADTDIAQLVRALA